LTYSQIQEYAEDSHPEELLTCFYNMQEQWTMGIEVGRRAQLPLQRQEKDLLAFKKYPCLDPISQRSSFILKSLLRDST
jgi:hypothetical protein